MNKNSYKKIEADCIKIYTKSNSVLVYNNFLYTEQNIMYAPKYKNIKHHIS